MSLTAVSLFAGIGTIDLGMQRAGIRTVAAVEIDPARRGVLARHFPEATLFSDVEDVTGGELLAAGFDPRRGVVAAGWPCQGNSLAGRRGGMDDPRSGLWRHVVRVLAETRARWFLGENVPGLYSVNRGRDIAVVRRDLAQLGYWWAERILDAQYFGVPQRRRRVFFVGHLGGDGAAPVQVLLEPEGSGGDSAAGGAAGPGVAVVAALSPSDGGADDNDGRGGRLIVGTLTTGTGGKRGWRVGADEAAAGHLVAAPLRAGNHHGDHAAAESHLIAGTLSAKWAKGTGGPSGDEAQNLVPVAFDRAQITSPESRANPQPGDPAMTLAAGGQPHVAYALRADPGGVGQGHNTNYVPVSLAAAGGISTGVDVAQTIRAGHSQSPGMVAAEAFIVDKERDRPNAAGINVTPTDVASTITARDPAEQNDRGLRIVTPAAVRRLTPTECERLQGVPDGWTELSDGKPQSDSARYRQLGDAAAVPVIEWIARRLVAVHEQEGEEPS